MHRILVIKPDLKETAADPNTNNLINELFRNCLFDLENRSEKFEDYTEGSANNLALNKNYIKCKSTQSRKVAYELLELLCKDSMKNTEILIKNGLFSLLSNMPKKKKSSGYSWMRNDSSRSTWGYAGIKNPCCICYMNSMNQ